MTLRVHAACYYRSKSDEWTDKWEKSHFNARNIVKGVKRLPFDGFTILKTASGKSLRLDNTPNGQAIALKYAAQLVAGLIQKAGYEHASVVPIPASDHVNPGQDFTGSRLAQAIQQQNPNFVAEPVLYFDSILPKSAGGGGRDAHEIQQHLRATQRLATLQNIVLIDDVYTSGAHLRAAARFLRAAGKPVEDGFFVGRTVWSKPDSMFSCPVEQIAV